MKKLFLLLCAWPFIGGAITLVPSRLPRPLFVDTEVTTNCPLPLTSVGLKDFRVDMGFEGTSSNNVQLAFGRDADADGVLSVAETDLIVAWDCGCWVLSGAAEGSWSNRVETTAATSSVHKDFAWRLTFQRERPLDWEMTENEEVIFSEQASEPRRWFHDMTWDLFRVTVRGVEVPSETIGVTMRYAGVRILIR